MRVPLSIAALVVGTCMAYTCVGHMVPQKEQHPPKEVSGSASPEQLAEAGKSIFADECTQCHGAPGTGGTERAPDVDGVATRASERAEERTQATGQPYTGDDYLAESLFEPGAYLVRRDTGDEYGNIMSFKLEPNQILALLAYLQTLGGEPTVTATSDVWKKWGEVAAASAAAGGTKAGPKPQGSPDEIIKKYGCVACHDFEGDKIPQGGGPPLSTLGSRMSRGDILMQVLYPDTEISKFPVGVEYPKGVMKTTLDGNGFYDEMGGTDMQKLVVWLFEKKGAQ